MMNWLQLKTLARFKLFALFVPLLLLAAACGGAEAELIAGILQNVDSVNGEITIVTEDGKTVTVTIATDALVETEGASSAIETLEPGASVELEVNEDGQVAQRITARQAKAKGVIVEIEGNEVTILESERGRRLTVLVNDRTYIKLEDDFPGALADLRVGAEAVIKFDPKSRVAFKIDAEEEEAKIEGIVVEVEGDQVTVETERGRRLTLLVGDRTRIELEDDFPGTTADLQVGAAVEAKFDPYTQTAFKIGVEEEEAEIEGVVVELAGNEVTVETKSGRRLTLVIGDRTRIELEDDFPGTYADLKVGEAVGAKFDPVTRMAFKLDGEGRGQS